MGCFDFLCCFGVVLVLGLCVFVMFLQCSERCDEGNFASGICAKTRTFSPQSCKISLSLHLVENLTYSFYIDVFVLIIESFS